MPPPSRSPVVLASDEREIVKVARLEMTDHAMSQSQNMRSSDVVGHQGEPVSPPDSEYSRHSTFVPWIELVVHVSMSTILKVQSLIIFIVKSLHKTLYIYGSDHVI